MHCLRLRCSLFAFVPLLLFWGFPLAAALPHRSGSALFPHWLCLLAAAEGLRLGGQGLIGIGIGLREAGFGDEGPESLLAVEELDCDFGDFEVADLLVEGEG